MGARAWLAKQREREVVARAADAPMYSTGTGIVVPSLSLVGARERERHPSATTALGENPLIWGAAYRYAMRLGALPIKVYRYNDDGSRSEQNDHPGYRLLRHPNPTLTRPLLISGTVWSMFEFGRCGWLKERNARGTIEAVWPVPGNLLYVVRDDSSIIAGYEIRVSGAEPVEVDVNDMCYFRLMVDSSDWADGVSPTEVLQNTHVFSDAAIDAMTDLFVEGFLERLWIDLQGKQLSDERKEAIAQQMSKARKSGRGIPMIEDGAYLRSMGAAPTSEVMSEAVKLGQQLVAEAFTLPVSWEDDHALHLFYSEGIQPIADAMEQEMERSLFTEWSEPAFPEFAFREILRGTPGERITQHRDAVLSAQETPNEARRMENLPPKEGGDDLFVPLNLVPIGQAPEVAATGKPREKDSAGGLGGVEGRDTLPRVAAGQLADVTVLRTERDRRWSVLRQRVLDGQAEAFARQVRGLLNDELRTLRHTFEESVRARDYIPPVERLLAALDAARDAEVVRLLRRFMQQTSDVAWRNAFDLLGAQALEAEQALSTLLDQRASTVAARFGTYREQALRSLFEQATTEGWTTNRLAGAVNDLYAGTLKEHLVDGIGRTEMAFAHEESARIAWRQAGVRELDFVFGGGPCKTAVCEEAAASGPYPVGTAVGDVGGSFAGATTPPLHPSCTCFMIPVLA